ncbi:hypothetical protein B0H10DRAFT_2112083 [Mycena sp. CBHHK59/15]|nr:hypothetical protein B0H10DRAFT_2112083 [Mycena sp. CBHHK59/15]
MSSVVPSDIWRYIAGFIPTNILITLYSVNSTFLEIATEAQYHAINFNAYKTAKPLIKHVRGSQVVHTLRVQPWMVQAKQPKPSPWSLSTWKSIYACVSPTYAETEADAQLQKQIRKQIQRVAEAIKGFPNLHTYHIDWDEGPFLHEFYSSLLCSVVPAVGRRICVLTLKVPLHHMSSLPGLAKHLPNLESLALTLHTGAYDPHYISQQFEGLVVFVNVVLCGLRSLSIHTTPTSTHLDLGRFFTLLGRGRRLRSFTLCIPFDGGHLEAPAPFRRFLSKHRSTIESLTLGTTRAAARPAPGAEEAKFWIRESLKDHPPFPALSHLALGLRPLRTDLGPLLRCLNGVRTQLRTLRLAERPLEYTELAVVLAALADAPLLQSLSLRIRWLSPELVDLLAAAHLPALRSLELNFAEVVHQEPKDDSSSVSDESYCLSRASELMFFCHALNGRKYPHWSLTRLAVPESPRGQIKWLDDMERAFIGCVPALTSFGEVLSPA